MWDQALQGHGDIGERSKPRRLHSWAERQGKGCLHLLDSSLWGWVGGIRRTDHRGAVDTGRQVSGIKGLVFVTSGVFHPKYPSLLQPAYLPAPHTERGLLYIGGQAPVPISRAFDPGVNGL